MAHGSAQWTTVLPFILLGFRTTWKKDLQATAVIMIYGAPIRLLGKFLCQSKQSADPATFVGSFRETMLRLSPPMTRHHEQNTFFMSKDLTTCSIVFLRTYSIKKNLKPLYESPYKVVDHTEKVFHILRHGKDVSESVVWLKPAYVFKELMDILAGENKEIEVSSEPVEVLDTGQEIFLLKVQAGKKPLLVTATE
ncbi:uncharacterized protein NPIL_46121 [Nephila pilipes]|uniref:Uncharacterized protein n=1 Tax=Nephila pilipes TaxID=299642 RepID=A0A8X6UCD5_NEPPI|nr:uncharacterized protein NPIL_46121 [Nephila pilipes]